MSHLIQTIDIEGTKYCPTYQSGRMTSGVLTNFELFFSTNSAEITTPESPWKLAVLPGGAIDDKGEISFAVACGSTVLVDFTTQNTGTTPDYGVAIVIFVDGGPGVYDFLLTNYDPDSLGFQIDLTDVPCGSIVTLFATLSLMDTQPVDGVITVTAEITSIT